jgi:hypothetical protein
LKVEAETPESVQGETDERPRPTPSASKPKELAAATTAPAAILAHETTDCASAAAKASVRIGVSTGFSL